MLSSAELAKLADNLAELGLAPATQISIGIAIGRALSDDAAPTPDAPRIATDDAMHTNEAAPPAAPRGRPKRTPLPPAAVLTSDTQHAISFLRGTLLQGPRPASEIEEAAGRKGIGSRSLERAKEMLGVTATRRPDGQGVCLVLPSNAANGAAVESD